MRESTNNPFRFSRPLFVLSLSCSSFSFSIKSLRLNTWPCPSFSFLLNLSNDEVIYRNWPRFMERCDRISWSTINNNALQVRCYFERQHWILPWLGSWTGLISIVSAHLPINRRFFSVDFLERSLSSKS